MLRFSPVCRLPAAGTEELRPLQNPRQLHPIADAPIAGLPIFGMAPHPMGQMADRIHLESIQQDMRGRQDRSPRRGGISSCEIILAKWFAQWEITSRLKIIACGGGGHGAACGAEQRPHDPTQPGRTADVRRRHRRVHHTLTTIGRSCQAPAPPGSQHPHHHRPGMSGAATAWFATPSPPPAGHVGRRHRPVRNTRTTVIPAKAGIQVPLRPKNADRHEPGPDRRFPLIADSLVPARRSPSNPVEAYLDPGLRRDDGIFFQG